YKATAGNASLWIGNQELGMRQLIDAESPARAACAFGIVEDEIGWPDIAIYKMMRGTGDCAVKPLCFALACPFYDVHLQQPVTHQQGARDSGLDGFLVLAIDDESVHERVHVADARCIDIGFGG